MALAFSTLKDQVFAWVNKPEVEPALDTLIMLAEAKMNRSLSEAGVTGSEGRSTTAVDAEYSLAPADYGAPIEMTVSDGAMASRVANITQASFDTLKGENPTQTGRPVYFTSIGSELRYLPAPDAAYTVTLRYQRTLAALSANNASNWLLDRHPDVYLYGVLLQAAPYLGEDKRLAIWSALYEDAMAGLISAERRKQGLQRTPAFRSDLVLRRSSFNINTDR